MKQFHRNQADSSAKTGKKGRKLKKNQSVEACKCIAPFVKLHWWDCPEVNKPCPIHGNVLYQNMKPEKVEPDQNVTISFHPSSRTEKLFEPVKALLAQCDPETKINFQYFSPECFKEKENLKNQTIQTSFEDLRKGISSNVFVEKKKSSNENTNKMKKLKECFHSPCNSIAQKYPSPSSVRRNFNENSFEESTQPWQKFFNGDVNQNSEWFAPNPFGYKKLEKMPGDKRNSDFITVTQHDDNVINHKIYEIDHRKGLNENLMSGFGKHQTQIAYSSFNVNYPNQGNHPNNYKFSKMEENRKAQENPKKDSYENSQMSLSSAGSVYVAPFFLMPQGLQISDEESDDGIVNGNKRTIGVQVKKGDLEEPGSKLITRYCQKSTFESDSASEQKMTTVSLQTDHRVGKKYSRCADSSDDTLSDKCKYNGKVVQTNIHENVRIDREKTQGGSKFKSTEVQTTNRYQVKEVLITRYNKPMKEAGSQIRNSECEIQESCCCRLEKSPPVQNSSFGNKQTQVSCESEEDTEYRNFDYEYCNQKPNENVEKVQECEEKNSSPVSDLSELKRLIFEFFDKATCNCKGNEIEMRKKSKSTASTMTDCPKVAKPPKCNEMPTKNEKMSREIQTSDRGMKCPEAPKPNQNCQPPVPDEVTETKTCDDVCPFCGRNIRRLSLNASTNTDDMYAIKEKTTIIETDVTEITKIKKTCPKNSSRKSLTNSSNVRPITYCKTDSQRMMKTTQAHCSPTRTCTPAPVATSSTRTDRQDWAKQSSVTNFPVKPSSQREKRPLSQTYRECRCKESNDLFCPMQENKSSKGSRSNRQDDDCTPNKYREDSRERKDDQKPTNRHFYHVSVNPSWPRDLTNAWKSQDAEESSKQNQKAEEQQAEIYPLKPYEESQQNLESEKQNEKKRKHEYKKRDNFGFLRIPYSSASQVSITKATSLQSKVIKSEESVNASNQHLGCTAMKLFGDDANDLFTVKSCHLNPIRIAYDDQSCDKLLTCSFCRSLMLIKVNNKNDGITYVPGLNDAIQSQNTQSESDEVPERQSYEKFALLRENVDEQEELEKSSNYSDLSTRTNENFFKEGNSDLES